ncbi:O-antigen ligase family protein [Cellulomonas sp. ICMP 17802]|uniref:O-antigen ligase family protein n=1 Tax=Cellulomonas sp. ICMP 17802 TaxID=3239199 RepID=UPI00351B4601
MLIISLYARTIQTTDSRGLSTVTSILAGWIILESILVIGFRLFPSIEDRFYRSPLGDVFVGSQRLDGYFGLFPDNATAFNKAGGFWLNANTASMFLGAAAWALVWAYVLWRRKIVAYGAAMAFFAVPFTGSKTGLVLLVATVFFVVALRWLLARYGGAGVAVLALTALPLYIFVTHLVELLPSTFRSDSSESLGSRGLIWSVARDLFHQYPAQGLGFGGWTNEFASRIGGLLAARLPPHNTFIAYWANTGLLGASLLFGLWIAIAVTCVRMVKRSRWSRWASAAVCASLGWIAIHGMGDAVDFYGDERSMLLFGLLLGVIVVGSSPREDVEDLGLASNATSGYARPDVPTNRVRSRPELGRVP